MQSCFPLLRLKRMEIAFNAKSLPLPYATVATNLLLKKPSTLALKTVAETQPLITLKTTPDAPNATALQGETYILRYLARSASRDALSQSPLYPEHKPSASAAIDLWLSRVQTAMQNGMTPKDVLALARSAHDSTEHSQTLVATSLSLADLSLWGAFCSHDRMRTPVPGTDEFPRFVAWMQRMNAMPECQQAKQLVDALLVEQKGQVAKAVDGSAKGQALRDGNALEVFRQEVAKAIHAAVPEFDVATLSSYLEIPKSASAANVDFCLPVPRLRLKGNPAQAAKELASKISPSAYIESVETAGTFLNFAVNKTLLRDLLIPEIHDMYFKFGTNRLGEGKTVVVEFSSPNIAKPFHAGHLRSTIMGNFIRNACNAHGMKTIAINYLGDWGKQYGLLAVGFEHFGSEEQLAVDPIKHLFDVYVEINKLAKEDPSIDDQARAYFKRMEDGDQAALTLWQRFRDLSISKYKQIYARLNVEFDVYSGESQFAEGMKRSLKHLQDRNLLTPSDGAMIVDLEKYKLTPALIQKADGATLYITRDIAAAWERHDKYGFDEMYYVVAAAQNLHFQQLFKILELSGFEWHQRCHHINFGMVNGMSTRRGNVVFLEHILDEAKTVMHEVMQRNERVYSQIENPMETADIIGTSAVIIQDFGARRIKDYEFNWDRMTSFEGDTGPFLQYSHARLCSIERQYLASLGVEYDSGRVPALPFSKDVLQHVTEQKCMDMVMALAQWPDIVAGIPGRNFEPNNVVVYLMALCHKVSSCLKDVYVMGREKDVALARFWLYWSARVVVGNGMRLLGLKPLERM